MTEANEEIVPLVQDELKSLKERADLVGMKYHHKVGAKKLKALLEAHMSGETLEAAEEAKKQAKAAKKAAKAAAKANEPIPETPNQRALRLRKEAGRLVRIRVSCMNPNKKDYDGEIFAVSNSVVGTFKKFVPFNNDAGWHVPQIILNHLLEKECQIFHTVTINGRKVRKGKLIKELNVQIMDPLTIEELHDLQQQQAMAGGLG